MPEHPEDMATAEAISRQLGEHSTAIRALQDGEDRLEKLLTNGIADLRHEIRGVRDGLRVPPMTYIAAGSLAILLGGAVLAPLYREDNRLSETFAAIHSARIVEVNRRFEEDVDRRFTRIEDRNADEFKRLRVWLLNIDTWREQVTSEQGESRAIERIHHHAVPQL